jgi:hypothetical protein
MCPSIHNDQPSASDTVVRSIGSAALLAVIGLSGCVIPNASAEPSGPPAAWVQRSNPINPAPLEFEHRTTAVPPILELQTNAQGPAAVPFELTPPLELGPEVPAPLPAAPELPQFPPLAPGAEAFTPPETIPVPAPTEPAVTQAMLDELSTQIRVLTGRVEEQSAALNDARAQSDAARFATQRLQSEFITWRAELDVVRETIQAQSAADLQALDELNQTLEQFLNVPETPAPSPGDSDSPQTANGRRRRGATR